MAAAKLLTAIEAARIVSKVSGRKCSARRVRYLLVQGGLGTELQPRRQGQTRLFGPLDLAILRLAIELERQGISPWVGRVVLTYLRDDVVRAFKSAAPVALTVTGVKGRIEPALKSRPSHIAAWVPLRDVWKGLEQEITALREARPTVWMWADVPCSAVKRATSGTV
jgi:hypothetical protein